MRSIVSLTERSLPGIGVAEKITVSPLRSATLGWSPWAMRRSADSGSPCDPVEHPVGDLDVAEVAADVDVLAHRPADQRDLAAERVGGVDHLLDAVDVR